MSKRRTKNDPFNALLFVLIVGIFWGIVTSKKAIYSVIIIALGILFIFLVLLYFRIRKRSKVRAAIMAAGSENPMQLTPEQYEEFCSNILANNGWKTSLTRKSGDFGADVIAEKAGQKIIIQCKQWSKSVGVKAVQEAHAAASHYRANQAIVVTTTGYTQAAKALAKSTGVRLLSHTDLVDM